MLWIEFGIDVKPSAAKAIRDGRRSWRAMQIRAAVSDDPESAAAELIRLGYAVTPPAPALACRLDRVQAI